MIYITPNIYVQHQNPHNIYSHTDPYQHSEFFHYYHQQYVYSVQLYDHEYR